MDIPTGYTWVEYLESDGLAFIQLPITFSPSDEVFLEAAILSLEFDDFIVSPKTWNESNNRFALHGNHNTYFCVGYGSHSTGISFLQPNIPKDTDKHISTYSGKVFKMDQSSYNANSVSFGSNSTTEIRLFYGYNSPTVCRIWRYRHYKTGGGGSTLFVYVIKTTLDTFMI